MSVCWWGDMTFPDHVYELLRMRGFRASVRFVAKTLEHDDRKVLARAAHRAIEQGFVPSVATPVIEA